MTNTDPAGKIAQSAQGFTGCLLWLLPVFQIFSGEVLGQCPDWYQNTLECMAHRKVLRQDSANNLCGELLKRLDKKSKDLDKLQKIVYCLNEVAPPSKVPAYRKILKNKLPKDGTWYLNQLKKYRIHRELASALTFAYLVELGHPNSPATRAELTETYRLNGKFLEAGLSYLKGLNLGKYNSITILYSLKDLIRAVSAEKPARVFLDSLIAGFPTHSVETYSLLEDLCWNHGHYTGALRCFMGTIRLAKNRKLPWKDIAARVEKFLSLEQYDNCRIIMEKADWRLTTTDYLRTQQQFFKIHYHLKHWQALIKEFEDKNGWEKYNWETRFYLATAFLKADFGNHAKETMLRKQSRQMTKQIIEKANSPWKYRAVLLQVEGLLRIKDFSAADKLLRMEKNNPERREGTGALLFWQAMSKLYQFQFETADSLLVIASAYTDENTAQRAMQFRFWLMQDTSAEVRKLFFLGIEESSLSYKKRIQSLGKLPENSPLYLYGQLEKALVLQKIGEKDSVRAIFKKIIIINKNLWFQADVKSQLNFNSEKNQTLHKSLAIYDEILLKYQQGMVPEFVRERIRYLKNHPVKIKTK